MESLDTYLCELFFKVLKKHLTDFLNNDSVKKVKKTLPEIRKKYKGERVRKGEKMGLVRSFPSEPCASISNMQNVAYFYECSTCLASSTATSFLELTSENFEFFQKKMHRKCMSLCCIAGGIASEIVAVMKILCTEVRNSDMDFLVFRVTFVNSDDKWNKIIQSVMTELEGEMKTSHKIKIVPYFVSVQAHSEILDVFHSADILISTKFSQELCDMNEKNFKQLLEIAFEHMKADSLFFFIDTLGANMIDFLMKTVSKFPAFHSVYKKTCDHHSLSIDSIKHHLKRYGEYFGVDLNCSYCYYSACSWIKLENRRGSIDESQTSSTAHRNRMKKDKKDARKSAYWFRRSVEILYSHADQKF